MAYKSGIVPKDPAAIPAYLERELTAISRELVQLEPQAAIFDRLEAVPSRPREGFIGYFAADVHGPQAGYYSYIGGAWQRFVMV
jgi:hypothetical protein